ncbi:Uncharacterised protein [Vibrio cholerae]|nr:Uncharacterised protein [Vibrio cholerae]
MKFTGQILPTAKKVTYDFKLCCMGNYLQRPESLSFLASRQPPNQ